MFHLLEPLSEGTSVCFSEREWLNFSDESHGLSRDGVSAIWTVGSWIIFDCDCTKVGSLVSELNLSYCIWFEPGRFRFAAAISPPPSEVGVLHELSGVSDRSLPNPLRCDRSWLALSGSWLIFSMCGVQWGIILLYGEWGSQPYPTHASSSLERIVLPLLWALKTVEGRPCDR